MASATDHRTQAPSASFHFSTEALPVTDRVGIFREVFGQRMLRLDMEPVSGHRFQTDATVRSLPGFNVVWASNSPLRVSRTRQLLSDGNDDLLLQWADAAGSCVHLGREIALRSQDAVVLSCSDIGSVSFPSSVNLISLGVPRSAVGALLRDGDACLGRPVARGSGALRLLLGYVGLFRGDSEFATAEVQRLAVTHIYDILAVVLGATRDAAQIAETRGVSAARLWAVKKEIDRRATDGDLSLSDVAAEFRLSPRYVQMLFERDGTTFTEYLLEKRLACAYRMLLNGRFGSLKISDIAFDSGFADISYFNRAFRNRYGITPSGVRHERKEN
jgi:AraC-like DNA-binding protein